MNIEKYRWLAGVIAAHKDRQIVGRTRLQKEMKLLQSLGLPSNYLYKTHFYGPYSEGVQADIGLLESMGLVTEETNVRDDRTYYTFLANENALLPEIDEFQDKIDIMSKEENATILELAATYNIFRENGSNHEDALTRLQRKKGSKCDNGNQEKALELLKKLGLENS